MLQMKLSMYLFWAVLAMYKNNINKEEKEH